MVVWKDMVKKKKYHMNELFTYLLIYIMLSNSNNIGVVIKLLDVVFM